MNKKYFVSALALFTLISLGVVSASAQQSCPNQEAFGMRQSVAADSSSQSQIEVTYFTTNDPNVFISEKDGLKRSSRFLKLNAAQFVARLGQLQNDGVASIRKSQSATAFFGELAALNLESNSAGAKVVNANHRSNSLDYLRGLDRETEVSVSQNAALDGDYYRVELVSWFVNANAGSKSVDSHASVLLKPGQTAIFKLVSNDELGRSGSARSYMAVTLRSVNKNGLASHGSRSSASLARK
ncbi:MAG TPA: hypothetical protein VF791_20810 [Pyrinomonadaceae bacterium]